MMDMQEMTIGEIIELIQSTETTTFKLEGLGETTISTIKLKPLVEAYEKQIPKPPEYKYYKENPSLWEIYHCQSCNAILLNYELYPTDYCNKCGQKLKGESSC